MIFERMSSENFLRTKKSVGGIYSISQFVERFSDLETGKNYFVKKDLDAVEFRRYHVMIDVGVENVPSEIFYLEDTESLVTCEMGQPSQKRMLEKGNIHDFFCLAANLILDFHTKIDRIGNIDLDLIKVRSSHTSHPIFNFNSRFIEKNSTASNAFLEYSEEDLKNLDLAGDLIEPFKELSRYVFEIVEGYERKVMEVIDDCHEDNDIALGDFKPENIIIDENKKLTLIDPSFVKGNKIFDPTKFVSRLLLEGVNPIYVFNFLELCYKQRDIDKSVYRGFSKKELINMDMVNILSSYLGRFLLGNKNYRLVDRLNLINKVLCEWKNL